MQSSFTWSTVCFLLDNRRIRNNLVVDTNYKHIKMDCYDFLMNKYGMAENQMHLRDDVNIIDGVVEMKNQPYIVPMEGDTTCLFSR